MTKTKQPAWIFITASIAIAFGLMTLRVGSSVLFFDGEARLAAGNFVEFILWFNFIAGFFYIATGIGIWLKKIWAIWAAIAIALLTLLAFSAFGLHILYGNEYESRTVIAMTIRSLVWISIATIGYRAILPRPTI